MGNPTKSKINVFRRLYLVFIALVNPNKFNEEEVKDNKLRANLPEAKELSKIEKVRLALFTSLIIVMLAWLVGYMLGVVLQSQCGAPDSRTISFLQSLGAVILLLATIAVRGNEIATWDGVTLSERVNRWIFEALYFIGTTLLVISVSW